MRRVLSRLSSHPQFSSAGLNRGSKLVTLRLSNEGNTDLIVENPDLAEVATDGPAW